ncbi:hypothetical protein C2845_PM02G05160 [Panicum miliaceum]|uniref:Uncharacterized protein n=1 Tax=Panicum miliaceum TaxID=4540 RepID=A0A3L6S6F2_PANMI|nr:hypothetical protein C2845_PM02G05160 [Panicum miliaceum]
MQGSGVPAAAVSGTSASLRSPGRPRPVCLPPTCPPAPTKLPHSDQPPACTKQPAAATARPRRLRPSTPPIQIQGTTCAHTGIVIHFFVLSPSRCGQPSEEEEWQLGRLCRRHLQNHGHAKPETP